MSEVREFLKQRIADIVQEKTNFSREESAQIVERLRYEIGLIALELYVEKVGKITREDVVLGKISYNPRHIIRALKDKGIVENKIFERFVNLDDEEFYRFVFGKSHSQLDELERIVDRVEELIITLQDN